MDNTKYPHDSIAWRPTFSSNNLMEFILRWVYESLAILWRNFGHEFWPSLQRCSTSFTFFGHSLIYCSLRVPSQHFNWVQVWTLNFDSFIFQEICWCASDWYPVVWFCFSKALADRRSASHLTLEYSGIQRRSWSYSVTARCPGPVSSKHPIIITAPLPRLIADVRCFSENYMFGFHQT